jgi:hypothetical protein
LALVKVNRQRKRLKALMRETKTYNIELTRKNNIISEANLLKEKYMFKYMYISANFIKELDEYRKDLRHTYKEKGIEALMAKLREPEYMYMQYKSFYKIFDEIFLGIFPDFPDKVNLESFWLILNGIKQNIGVGIRGGFYAMGAGSARRIKAAAYECGGCFFAEFKPLCRRSAFDYDGVGQSARLRETADLPARFAVKAESAEIHIIPLCRV